MHKHSKFRNNYIPEIAFWLKRKKIPRMVSVNLTRHCNQHCIYCEIGKDSWRVEMDRLTVFDLHWIIDQMDQAGIRKLALCGGEPLLFRGFMDIIRYAGQKNVQCAVTSNGMKVYQLNDNELELLGDNGTIIHLSVDSFNEKIQTHTRGHKDALNNVVRSMHRLRTFDIPVTLLTVISRYNYKDLYSSARIAITHGIREMVYQPVISYSNYPDQKAIENKEDLNVPAPEIPVLLDQLSKIQQLERDYPLNTNIWRIKPWISQYLESMAGNMSIPFYKKVVPHFYCREVQAVIDISYDGGIQPCGLLPAELFIRDHLDRPLVETWQKATSSLVAELQKDHFPVNCNGCCHKFGRNMIASAMKYPLQNRAILTSLILSLGLRTAMRIKRYPTTDL